MLVKVDMASIPQPVKYGALAALLLGSLFFGWKVLKPAPAADPDAIVEVKED